MAQFRIRPRFRVSVDASPAEVMDGIEQELSKADAPCRGNFVMHHINLRLPGEDQHYWSPQLSLEIEEQGKGTLIRGLYGPKPAIWTFFIFAYGLIGFGALVGLMIGLSEWSLGMPAYGFIALPICLLAWLGIFGAARYGQLKGRDQAMILHHFITKTVYQFKGDPSSMLKS